MVTTEVETESEQERARLLEAVKSHHGNVEWHERKLNEAKANRLEAILEARKAGVEPAELAQVLGVTTAHISRIAPLKKQQNPSGPRT